MVIEELVETVLTKLKEVTQTETVVGEPIKIQDTTLVPVSRVSIGFGAGGGKQEKDGKGGECTGGGMTIEPVAFVVIRKDKVELIPMKGDESGLGKVIDLIPQVVEKVKEYRGKKEKSVGGKNKGSK
jgi:sporulation protein YtfJ